MFPNKLINHSISSVINLMNINFNHKILSFKIKYTKKNLIFIKILKDINVINSYSIIKITKNNHNNKLNIIARLSYFKNLKVIKKFKLFSKPSKNYYLSLKSLYFLNKRTGGSIYLISTSKGIITHKAAVEKKLSGYVVGFFFN